MDLLDLVYEIGKRISIPNFTIDRLPFQFSNQQERLISAEEVAGLWGSYLRSLPAGHVLDCYVNIPYCMRKCRYCQERSMPISKRIGTYVQYLKDSSSYFSRQFRGKSFAHLFVGGGTPSVLKASQIQDLFSHIFSVFSFIEDGEKTFELNPAFLTEEKLSVLKKLGFNRLSFGVQSMNPSTLDRENRGYQDPGKVKELMVRAKKMGFRINADLIIGLKDESPEEFLRSFEEVASLHPQSITLTRLNPTESYLKLYRSKDDFYDSFHSFYDAVEKELKGTAQTNGFSWRFLGRDSMQYKFARDGSFNSLYENSYPFSCFGIGAYADSRIFGSSRISNVEEREVFLKGDKVFALNTLTLDMEMYLYLFKLLSRNDVVDLLSFERIFGVSLIERFREGISRLESLGQVTVSDTSLVFHPRDDRSRFFYAFLFFDKDLLVRKYLELRTSR